MRRNFRLKLQNSPKLPHIHARLFCNANEKKLTVKGLLNITKDQLEVNKRKKINLGTQTDRKQLISSLQSGT